MQSERAFVGFVSPPLTAPETGPAARLGRVGTRAARRSLRDLPARVSHGPMGSRRCSGATAPPYSQLTLSGALRALHGERVWRWRR